MTHYHACVWIDHRQAKIFGVGEIGADEHIVTDTTSPAHIHRKADHVDLGKAGADPKFFGEVAGLLQPYKAILIAGPGTARSEFAGYLTEHDPKLAKRVWGIEPMDHPTDKQIVALVRKYFRAADRLHG
jgi:stalled ribosome rescue protein Dom34